MILISTIFIELSGVLLFIRTRLFCIGLIGIIVIIFKVFTDHRCSGIYICRFLNFEGRNSLTILGTHMLIMKIVNVTSSRLFIPEFFMIILKFIFIVFLCNCCILFFNKYLPFCVNYKKRF